MIDSSCFLMHYTLLFRRKHCTALSVGISVIVRADNIIGLLYPIVGPVLWFSLNLSVGVSKLHVAILARSSREMFQTVRIDWQYIMSRVRVSVHFGLAIFLYAKNTQNYREYRVAHATVYFNKTAIGHWSPAEPAKRGFKSTSWMGATGPSNSDNLNGDGSVCVRACIQITHADHFPLNGYPANYN